jgi:hypothetical protein
MSKSKTSVSNIVDGAGSRRFIQCDDNASANDSASDSEKEIEDCRANPRFNQNQKLFQNLLRSINVKTKYPITNAMILMDSSRTLTVTKASEQQYFIKMYSMETQELQFEEEFSGTYIKMKDVETNGSSTEFAVVFNDDGVFKLRTFGRDTRTPDQIRASEVNLNELIGIDDKTMAVSNFPDPFVTCCFVQEKVLFINLFYSYECTHYHFYFDFESRKILGQVKSMVIGTSKKNFPYKCFYNDEENEVYSFYRQGQCIIATMEGYTFQKMTDLDLGSMFLFKNRALIARTSSSVTFFKIKVTEEGEKLWHVYQTLPIRGFLFYIKGNIRIQICTDEKIYFYIIDQETLIATLDNVMYNFMDCVQMMIGPKVKYCVTYKNGQRSFNVFRAKYMHDFRQTVRAENLEGAKALEFTATNTIIVALLDQLNVYDSITYEKLYNIPIKLLESQEREPNEILAI